MKREQQESSLLSLTNEDSLYIEGLTGTYDAMMTCQDAIASIACDESDENVALQMNNIWSMPIHKVETATYYMMGQIIELRRYLADVILDKNDEE